VDASAIELLYRSHGHLVRRRARRLLGNEDDAREVLHEVFASLLDRPAQLRRASAPTTWLYAATTHACLNRIRNRKTRAKLLAAAHEGEGAAPAPTAASPEASAILRDLLAGVPESLAHVAVYYYADEMTQGEIAAVLGCSRRHVGDLIERLHTCLRQMEEAS